MDAARCDKRLPISLLGTAAGSRPAQPSGVGAHDRWSRGPVVASRRGMRAGAGRHIGGTTNDGAMAGNRNTRLRSLVEGLSLACRRECCGVAAADAEVVWP